VENNKLDPGILEQIKNRRINGISEDQIRSELAELGFEQVSINNAISASAVTAKGVAPLVIVVIFLVFALCAYLAVWFINGRSGSNNLEQLPVGGGEKSQEIDVEDDNSSDDTKINEMSEKENSISGQALGGTNTKIKQGTINEENFQEWCEDGKLITADDITRATDSEIPYVLESGPTVSDYRGSYGVITCHWRFMARRELSLKSWRTEEKLITVSYCVENCKALSEDNLYEGPVKELDLGLRSLTYDYSPSPSPNSAQIGAHIIVSKKLLLKIHAYSHAIGDLRLDRQKDKLVESVHDVAEFVIVYRLI
jgi:hypothetical protein